MSEPATNAPGVARLTLAIELSNPPRQEVAAGSASVTGVAFGRGVAGEPSSVEVLGVERLALSRRSDADLSPAIARLAERLEIAPRSIERVAISVGPGGYTSTRIAVATGAAIALAADAEAVPVPSARVAAANVDEPGEGFVVALASKRDTAWINAFDASGRPAPTDPASADGGRLANAGQLSGWLDALDFAPGVLWIDAFAPPGFAKAATSRGMRVRAPKLDAEGCLRASVRETGVAPSLVRPLYPREPEAIRRWRELGRD